MRLPRTIRVSYTTLRIREDPDLPSKEYGSYSEEKQLIRLQPGMAGPEAANTLLHELLHVGYGLGRMTKPGDDDAEEEEERVVTVLANHLTDVFMHNPKLWDWLQEQLRP